MPADGTGMLREFLLDRPGDGDGPRPGNVALRDEIGTRFHIAGVPDN